MPQESAENFDLERPINRFLKGLESHVPAILEWVGVLKQQLQPYAQELVTYLAPHLAELAQIDWVAVKRQLDELPVKSKKAMILASSKGWFFGWGESLEDQMALVEKLEVIKPKEIDEFLGKYYRENLQFLTNRLVERYPDRASVIRAAVCAHSERGSDGYFLSIPVFIAQADGLLTEIAKVNSAMMRAPGTTQELQASKALREKLAIDPESLGLIHPILKLHELDFMKSVDKRQEAAQASGEAFTALNRHQVMHGESWDYGTELNSLKAFSFLAFVGVHLPLVLDYVQSNATPGELLAGGDE